MDFNSQMKRRKSLEIEKINERVPDIRSKVGVPRGRRGIINLSFFEKRKTKRGERQTKTDQAHSMPKCRKTK